MEHALPTPKSPGNPQFTSAAAVVHSELLGKSSIHLPPDTLGVIVSPGTYWNVTSGKGISIIFPSPVTPGTSLSLARRLAISIYSLAR